MIKKYIFLLLGFVFVGIAYIGIIVPGIPTTVFLLIAVWFFSRSSKKFENWLMNHKIFGELITNWNLYNSIDFKSKIMAISLIVITFSFTVFYAFSFKIDVLFIMFAVLLSIFIITRPSPPQKN
tara:strand:+ start:665 stop:1036 length:372 start_codon:yes stop_codon:yes gene_type:complete